MKKIILLLMATGLCLTAVPLKTSAAICNCCKPRYSCADASLSQSKTTISHITKEFMIHREWMVKVFFEQKMLPAMMLMTEQLSAVAMQQVLIIGTFFDAKHQLETQRLFQEMTAIAHKDYQPSEGVCTFGTNVRSIAASDRNAEFTAQVISNRIMQRQRLAGDMISAEPSFSDSESRFAQFIATYCNPKDNANGLDLLCGSGGSKERRNKDINYTQTIDSPMTLKLDYSEGDNATPDEEDVLALAANLYGHLPPPGISADLLADKNGENPRQLNIELYQDMRAMMAKRSVAQNSFSAIAAMKAEGEKEVRPYLAAILKEMGVPEDDIDGMLDERPSYYAQMEILTKKIYQNPNFYTDLYDKPANVRRKAVAMQAIELMQKRDLFRSLLRSETSLSVILELAIAREQDRIKGEVMPGQ